jgi:protein involved in polysaccharide export with SLBB domain
VKFLYHPSETQRITVRPDGTLPLSITGDLDVNRLTVDEAEDLIRARGAKYLRDPVVTVTVVESGARAYIGGRSRTPASCRSPSRCPRCRPSSSAAASAAART